MHDDRKAAPARMNRIMHESRVAPIRLSQKLWRLSPPDHQAMMSAPSTPKAADSVAVAHPIAITEMMKTMSTRQGTSLRLRRSFSLSESLNSSFGVLSGLSSAHTMM